MTKCAISDCFAPDVACYLGETELCRCKNWSAEVSDGQKSMINKPTEVYLPWTGSALGLTDVGFISGCSKPKIVGILGAENAGKTSLLAAWYLLISRGLSAKIQRRFAGSFSLEGWESVSADLRWEPGQHPCFPPHTPSGARRSPGLLHMAFHNQASGMIQDYLFADAPGEWFGKWALNSEAPDAEGARWLARNADIFLLIADREALSGKRKGRARSELKRLTQRLGGELQDRPVALVWTKGDMPEDEPMESSVRESIFAVMPKTKEFQIQVLADPKGDAAPENSLLELLSWVMEQKALKGELPVLEYTGEDPFFMFGQRASM